MSILTKSRIGCLVALATSPALAANALDSGLTVQERVSAAYADFKEGKQEQTFFWYSGTVLAGSGALSLVLGSHFDGLAAKARNRAAYNYENQIDPVLYRQDRQLMQDRKDSRDLLFTIGLSLGVVGGSMMAYDWFFNQNHLSLQASPNAVGLAWAW